MRVGILATAIVAIFVYSSQHVHGAVVTAAVAPTYDSDGDGVADLVDNAPGAFNPSQVDSDGDQIGDLIDPTPSNPGPWINIGFGIGGIYNTTPGAGVTINYTVTNAPVGNYGHINMYLQPGITPDAYAFQSLATPGGSFFIPANLTTIPGLWDLNTPGTYNIEAWAFGPGVNEGYKGGSATVVVAVPEPAMLGVSATAVCFSLIRRRGTREHGKFR